MRGDRLRLTLFALLLGLSSVASLAQSTRTAPVSTPPVVRRVDPPSKIEVQTAEESTERTLDQLNPQPDPPMRPVRTLDQLNPQPEPPMRAVPTPRTTPSPADPRRLTAPNREIDRLNPQPDPPMLQRGRAPAELPTMRASLLTQERFLTLSPSAQRNFAGLMSRPPPAAELTVWDGRDAPPSEFFRTFEGPVTADRSRPSLKWYFRYSTRMAAASAIYQVSMFPFVDTQPDPLKPPGLIAQGKITLNPEVGRQPHFSVDFTPVARPRLMARIDARADLSMVPETTATARAPSVALSPDSSVRQDRKAIRADATPSGLIRERLLPEGRLLVLRTGYYVRVVLKSANGKALGRPSNAVRIIFDEPTPPSEFEMVMGTHPQVFFGGYTPVRPDDWAQQCIRKYVGPAPEEPDATSVWGFGLPSGDMNSYFTPGMIVNICAQDDDSWLEDLADALGDFVGALGDFFNQVVAVYEWAKSQAVALAVSALDELGVPCPCPIGSCEVCVTAALDYGLASLGIPPNLPNFDQLVNQGVDYLAVSIAAETGLPMGEAVDVARMLADEAKSGGGSAGTGGGPVLWVPLEEHLYAPLVVKFRVGPSRWPVNLVIDNPDGLYERAMVPVPAVDRELLVPVALLPTEAYGTWKDKLPTAESLANVGLYQWAKEWAAQMQAAADTLVAWQQRYTQGVVKFEVSTLSASGSGYTTQKQLTLRCSANQSQCAIGK